MGSQTAVGGATGPDGRHGSPPPDRRASVTDAAFVTDPASATDPVFVTDLAGAAVPPGDLVARAALAVRPVVLVDGRSGTGKTTLAESLARRLDAQLVHLDDVYQGWDGLRAAADAVVDEILAAPDAIGRPRWRRWDWAAGLPAEWHALDATRPLVVEGCGSLSRGSAPRATFRIWLDGDDAVRKERALARDGAVFAREWDRWAAEELVFIEAEDPRSLADVVVRLP